MYLRSQEPGACSIQSLSSQLSQSTPSCGMVRKIQAVPRVIQGQLFHYTPPPSQRSDLAQRRQDDLSVIRGSCPLYPALFYSGGRRSPQEVPDFGIFSSIPIFTLKPLSPLLPSMAPTTDFKATLNTLPKITSPYLSASKSKIRLSRKFRMRDEFGDVVAWTPLQKKRKIKPRLPALTELAVKSDLRKVCLGISSWRLGSFHHETKRTVSFTHEIIEIDQRVYVQASELTSCELCFDQKLSVIFLQTSPAGCLRLRVQLNISRQKRPVRYDCGTSASSAEKYIVLVFENLPSAEQQNALDKILSGIGRANQLSEFPRNISLEEAINRIITEDKGSSVASQEAQSPPVSPESQEQTLNVSDTDGEDLLDERGNAMTPSASTESVKSLLVYPPPPAKGGITVTDEDFGCLKKGKFLNDVIIDFYLKYLLLEKLKSEDAERTHIFSSFFYKHLTQGRQSKDRTNKKESLKKRRHDRVKTWTRHVDLFKKDFLFVPINKAAHWFLAIVCFPGRCQPDPERGSPGTPRTDLMPAEPAKCNRLETRLSWRVGQEFSYTANPLSLFYKPTNSTTAPPEVSTRPEDLFSFDDEEDMEIVNELLKRKKKEPKPRSTEQPCILIMDSLGHGRPTVANILKEYLEEEWRVKKGTPCSFEMTGCCPPVPQQNNLSDCGIYLLQYVESFFESPLQSFEAPVDLSGWFPQERVAMKRKEIRQLIVRIQNQHQMAEKAKNG